MKYHPQVHHPRTIRLKGFDTTQPGTYFVTVFTDHREEIFGKIRYWIRNALIPRYNFIHPGYPI